MHVCGRRRGVGEGGRAQRLLELAELTSSLSLLVPPSSRPGRPGADAATDSTTIANSRPTLLFAGALEDMAPGELGSVCANGVPLLHLGACCLNSFKTCVEEPGPSSETWHAASTSDSCLSDVGNAP